MHLSASEVFGSALRAHNRQVTLRRGAFHLDEKSANRTCTLRWTFVNKQMHSSATSDHSSGSSKTKLFHIEFSDLHVSKEDSIKPWCDQLECQLFETEYLADEDSVSVPADVAAIIHPSEKETLRVRELRQLAW